MGYDRNICCMNLFKLLLFSLLVAACLSACEKMKEDRILLIRIEGFLLTDNYGTVTGAVGQAKDDWGLVSPGQFSSLELSFLNFPDTITLNNTAVCEVQRPVAFPNPFQYQSAIHFQTTDSVKVKIAITDAYGVVWRNNVAKMSGSKTFYFDFSDSKQFPSGTSLRYYYSFSAKNYPHFKVGYGDIKICRTENNSSACF